MPHTQLCGRYTKWKKADLVLWVGKMVIAMLALLFNSWSGDNVSTVQRTETKESKNVSRDCYVTFEQTPNTPLTQGRQSFIVS